MRAAALQAAEIPREQPIKGETHHGEAGSDKTRKLRKSRRRRGMNVITQVLTIAIAIRPHPARPDGESVSPLANETASK
jgi:hypothetical protein